MGKQLGGVGMKIVVLEGSPNKDGSSNLLAKEFIRGAEEAGHATFHAGYVNSK